MDACVPYAKIQTFLKLDWLGGEKNSLKLVLNLQCLSCLSKNYRCSNLLCDKIEIIIFSWFECSWNCNTLSLQNGNSNFILIASSFHILHNESVSLCVNFLIAKCFINKNKSSYFTFFFSFLRFENLNHFVINLFQLTKMHFTTITFELTTLLLDNYRIEYYYCRIEMPFYQIICHFFRWNSAKIWWWWWFYATYNAIYFYNDKKKDERWKKKKEKKTINWINATNISLFESYLKFGERKKWQKEHFID